MKEMMFSVPEAKRVRVILDTDAACEADDQYAIVHALMSPKIEVVGICSEHFADRFGPNSEQSSYAEIQKILELMEYDREIPIFHGASKALESETCPIISDASEFIVREALRDDQRPLFITGQGALTNIASAYLTEPAIAGKFTLVWIGGGSYPHGESEFNVENDMYAANVVLGSDIPVWQVPKDLYSAMYVPLSVLHERVRTCGKIGKYLVDNISRVQDVFIDWIKRPNYTRAENSAAYPGGEMWIMGDSPAVGLILFDQRYRFEVRTAPRIVEGCRYIEGARPERKIRVYTSIDRDFIMDDFYAKLKYYFGD